jgi:hypothetical protein
MRITSWSLALLLSLGTTQAFALAKTEVGSVVEVSLEQLHPTQTVVGYDQIYFNLGRFAKHRGKLFNEYCQSNGQGDAHYVPKSADLLNPGSFECEARVGTHPKEMKTVVIGPGGQMYLTDGHHTFTTFWEQPGAGPQLKMWVRVTADYSDSPDMTSFWQRMNKAHKVWLKDGNGQVIKPEQLPEHLGLKNLQNDPFRSLVYFVRGAAYGRPSTKGAPPEFLEFYWGDWLRPQVNLSRYDLGKRADYHRALTKVGKLMTSLRASAKVGKSGLTVLQLGGQGLLDTEVLDETVATKLPVMLEYKAHLRSEAAVTP